MKRRYDPAGNLAGLVGSLPPSPAMGPNPTHLRSARWMAVTLAVLVMACPKGPRALTHPRPDADVEPDGNVEPDAGVDAGGNGPLRVVAFGDVHGDLIGTRQALRLTGTVDMFGHWIGGRTVLVQGGDQLDRGGDERAILDLFEGLRDEATAAGGAFHPLLGNHETMNVDLDLRYVTLRGFADFADIEYPADDEQISSYDESERGRVAAFRPGGPYARVLAEHQVIVQVEDTVFVHGALLPEHVEYGVDRINDETQAWMRGEQGRPAAVAGSDSPVWSEQYSSEPEAEDCALLEEVLDALGARRMVVAHRVQELGINSECDGRVWRIDVGISAYYGGTPQALEIVDGRVTILKE